MPKFGQVTCTQQELDEAKEWIEKQRIKNIRKKYNKKAARIRREKYKKRLYHKYLRSWAWKQKRKEILKYYKYQCQKCKTREKLQIHHLNYRSLYREKMKDVLVLCCSCHQFIHKVKKANKRLVILREII